MSVCYVAGRLLLQQLHVHRKGGEEACKSLICCVKKERKNWRKEMKGKKEKRVRMKRMTRGKGNSTRNKRKCVKQEL